MSLINTRVQPFKATAYHDGEFVTVTHDACARSSCCGGACIRDGRENANGRRQRGV